MTDVILPFPESLTLLCEKHLPASEAFLRRHLNRDDIVLSIASRGDMQQWIEYSERATDPQFFNWEQMYEQQQEYYKAKICDALVAVKSHDQLCAFVYYRHMPGSDRFQMVQSENMGKDTALAGLLTYIYTNTSFMLARTLGLSCIEAVGPLYLTDRQLERMQNQGFKYDGHDNMVLDVPIWCSGLKPDYLVNPDVLS